MNIHSLRKISWLVAVFTLLAFTFSITPVTQAAEISIDDQRCVNGDGVVEVTFPSDIESFELTGPNTDSQNTTATFKTFSGLDDGDYTLTAYTASGGATTSFTVDCDPPAPAPDPVVSITDQRCVNGDGVVEVSFENVVHFKLEGPNTDEQNTTANFKTFSDLDDGNYTLTVRNSDGDTTSISFTVDCDPVAPTPAPDPVVSITDQRCVNNDGVVEVSFENVVHFKLEGPNTDEQNTTADFKTFTDLDDGNYTLTVRNSDGDTTSISFTVDCDPAPTQPGPEISFEGKSCVAGDGTAEIRTTSGLDSYKLINTSTGSTVVNDTNGASSGLISFSNLTDGNYRFEGTLNGQTQSLNFTIDCDPAPSTQLTGSCSVSDSSIGLSDNVTFTANASGGQSPYSYSWNLEGSDDDDNTRSVTTEYNQTGTYDGTVTISDDDGDQIIRTCSVTVTVNDDDDDNGGGGGDRLDPRDKDRVRGARDGDFAVQCLPDKSIYKVGEVVLFKATIDSDDDVDIDDIDFDWSGASDIRESGRTATVQFRTGGVKTIQISAEHKGNTETDKCYAQIGRGVSLDQVPYTGPGDTLAFITTLLLLALGGSYAIIKRREEDGIPVGIPNKHN